MIRGQRVYGDIPRPGTRLTPNRGIHLTLRPALQRDADIRSLDSHTDEAPGISHAIAEA